MTAPPKTDLLTTVFDLVDAVVELYLGSIIKPFLKLHETFYAKLNQCLRALLDDNKKHIPPWFTANWITYARTIFVIPTLLLLAWGHTILPAIIVIAVDFGDFLDGVVARYWIDIRKEEAKALESKDKSRTSSPTNSDHDSFEIVTTGSPHSVLSWVQLHRNRTYGGFIDAVCDKAFVIPCWISLLHNIPESRYLKFFQYASLILLILAETASASVRFQAYFTSGGVPAPAVQGFDFSTSAVKADHIGKAKQTFEMVGTALFILPLTRYAGLVFLMLAVPLAYESVRRKVKRRVIYVNGNIKTFDSKTLKFWMQAKAMGSKLIVGIPGKNNNADVKEMVLNACASSSVDLVIAEAPAKADLMFLEKQGIDFCICAPGEANTKDKFVTDEVVNANRCLAIAEDGIARPLNAKVENKDE